MNFTEIDRAGTVEGFALVKSCEKKNAKNGTVYLDLILTDSTGEINAKIWDYREGSYLPKLHSIVKIRGTQSVYNNRAQLTINKIRDIWDSDNVSLSDFVPSSEYDGKFLLETIFSIINDFENDELKKLVKAVLDEYGEKMEEWPAATRNHHAMRGGLLTHTLSIVRLCEAVAEIYPSVDRELLVAGAILHDICKVDEFNVSPVGLAESYTVNGELLGHLVMGAMAVDRIGREAGISDETLMLIEHMLISHHNIPEYGAAKRPMFLEAEILAHLDNLDAAIYEIEDAVRNIKPGEISPRIYCLEDRKFYNHGRKIVSTKVKLDE